MKRFWDKVDRTENCWVWIASTDSKGYGQFMSGSRKNADRKLKRAHRVAYELTIGDIPEGLELLHTCDNKLCVNPSHLRPGTHADNMRDMSQKDRSPRGVKQGRVILTEAEVLEIRATYIPKVISLRDLARRYGVNKSTIQLIVTGKNWSHI